MLFWLFVACSIYFLFGGKGCRAVDVLLIGLIALVLYLAGGGPTETVTYTHQGLF